MDITTQQIESELEAAELARAGGNEGRARVCARRAAGWSVGLACADQLGERPTMNAYLLLEWLSNQTTIAEPLRQAASRLTSRITEDHALPHTEDPLADARLIVRGLLDERNLDEG